MQGKTTAGELGLTPQETADIFGVPTDAVVNSGSDKKKTRRLPEKPREVVARLRADGWIDTKKGKGDHKNFKHPNKPGKVTVDMGVSEIPIGTLKSIYRQAGWEW